MFSRSFIPHLTLLLDGTFNNCIFRFYLMYNKKSSNGNNYALSTGNLEHGAVLEVTTHRQ